MGGEKHLIFIKKEPAPPPPPEYSTFKYFLRTLRGGGVQAYQLGKNDFELGVGGEGQDTSQNFEGSFGSIRALLPM